MGSNISKRILFLIFLSYFYNNYVLVEHLLYTRCVLNTGRISFYLIVTITLGGSYNSFQFIKHLCHLI